MRGRDRALCLFYGLFTVGGFLVMASMAVAYVLNHRENGPSGVVRDFLRDAVTNAASRFIYADLTLVWIALAGFMVVEARRLGIRYVWSYIIGAPVLALCVSFPLFMFIRQLKIASAAKGAPSPSPSVRLSAGLQEKGSDDH
ncbi:hypothetical protein SBI_00219 [Streptomyces bingchenggensis BCW-1]|uniref:DUF2834 domain-containing protein n=1 Tax=Streptomyces bingchenggensis (strain BCW-1) TaxID=749414 RepID=D7BWI4_STRBB|nr:MULTISPECIES: DUF2834 domain-containing protein [Streptomyces]ADI03340.1 hypothetical protein SBI_00219 [Streptomyces bingchenggensis BCW-1]